jgi:hypothetical protein
MSSRLRQYEEWLNSIRTAADVSREAYVECPIAHPTLVLRHDVAQLGYRDCGWPEDYDLVLRALAAGVRLGVVPRRLLAWRDRPGGLCRTDPAYTLDQFVHCKAYHLARGFLASDDAYVLWGFGATGRKLRRALAAYGKTPSHIIEVKPSRIGQLIHGAPVIPLERVPLVRGRPLVVSVARSGPRQEIRSALAKMNFVEGADFVCAA